MQKDLISILTPCYNTGALIHRLLDSVLMQDYPSVEMFCVDDGSTDDTRDVVGSYMAKFTERGYTLTYVYQENGGQSVAINNGLKLIHGEFLIWPDSDDYFKSEHTLTKMVDALVQHPQYGLCRCLTTYVDEDTLQPLHSTLDNDNFKKESLFEDCLYCQNGFLWGAGNYMARVSQLRKANPNMEIYTEKNAGQNWQMLLPLLYKFKCVPVAEQLFCVLVRRASHSRGFFSGYESTIEKISAYERTIVNTLQRIPSLPIDVCNEYIHNLEGKYSREKMLVSINFQKSVTTQVPLT